MPVRIPSISLNFCSTSAWEDWIQRAAQVDYNYSEDKGHTMGSSGHCCCCLGLLEQRKAKYNCLKDKTCIVCFKVVVRHVLVCMCVCVNVFMCVCVHVCMRVCVCVHACLYAYMYVCLYACTHTCLCACMCVVFVFVPRNLWCMTVFDRVFL